MQEQAALKGMNEEQTASLKTALLHGHSGLVCGPRCEPLSGVSIPIPRGSRGQILPLAPQPTSDRLRHGDQSADARHRALNDLIVRRDYEAGLITRWCGLRLVAGADRGLHGPSFNTSAVGHTSG